MARGKHKAKSANRRRSQAQSTIEQLQAELASERQLLADVAETREEAQQARARISDETAELLESSRPYVDRLEDEIGYLKDVLVRMRGEGREVKRAWGKYVEHCVAISPGRSHVERVESFFASMRGEPMVFLDNNEKPSLDTEQYLHLQRSRGQRTSVPDDPESQTKNLAVISEWFTPDLWRRLNAVGLVNEDGEIIHEPEDMSEEQGQVLLDMAEVAGKIRRSTAPTLDPDCLSIWGPGPLVRRGRHNNVTMTRLGAGGEPRHLPPTQREGQVPNLPLPSLSSKGRALIADMDPSEVVGQWRHALRTRQAVTKAVAGDASPFMAMSPHSRPSQGVVLQHLHSLSALGEWVRAGRGLRTESVVATGLTSAAAYWLPAGQAASFADSDPVDDEARAEMLLPFPQVFLAFAEPLVLEPSGPLDPHLAAAVRAMSLCARSSRESGYSAGSTLYDVRQNIEGGEIPFVEDILAQRGAKVEGVLLLSDDLSRPADEFAWCLSLSSDYGESIGRIVVPARRSTTAHSDLIDNLTAVVAWANWHEPDNYTEIPLGMKPEDVDRVIGSDDFKNDAQRAGAGVRVIDAVRTSRGGTRSKVSDGSRHVDPHIRRGHWRKQRHGPGRTKIKMVRISPTLVNAHLGDIGPRVYRLQ